MIPPLLVLCARTAVALSIPYKDAHLPPVLREFIRRHHHVRMGVLEIKRYLLNPEPMLTLEGSDSEPVFRDPYGVCEGPHGEIIISDLNNYKLHCLDGFSKKVLWEVKMGTGSHPRGVCVHGDGTVLMTDGSRNCVRRFSLKTGVELDSILSNLQPPHKIKWALDLCVDIRGDIYIADSDNHAVKKFSKDGTMLGQVSVEEFSRPTGIAAGIDGLIYVKAESNGVLVYDNNLKLVRPLIPAAAGYGVSVDARGRMISSGTRERCIEILDPKGKRICIMENAKWNSVRRVEVTSDGHLVVIAGNKLYLV